MFIQFSLSLQLTEQDMSWTMQARLVCFSSHALDLSNKVCTEKREPVLNTKPTKTDQPSSIMPRSCSIEMLTAFERMQRDADANFLTWWWGWSSNEVGRLSEKCCQRNLRENMSDREEPLTAMRRDSEGINSRKRTGNSSRHDYPIFNISHLQIHYSC